MNLKKGSSFDFDVLGENKGLITEQNSENGQVLVLGKYEPYPITITILPISGKARVQVYFRQLQQSMSFEIPLGIAREMSIPLSWSLGILRKMEGLELSIPLARIVTQVLEMVMLIHVKIATLKILVSEAGKIQYNVCFEGKPESKAESLEQLRKLLKGD